MDGTVAKCCQGAFASRKSATLSEYYIELRADLIAKERDVVSRMRETTDQVELRRLRDYRIDLHDAIHGWEQEIVIG